MRYAIIDTQSGYVFGVEDATSPVVACVQLDRSIGEYGRVYERGEARHLRIHGTSSYAVYEAPSGFDVADGQDQREIERVQALPLADVILTYRKED